ncbi:MAG: glycosyltransferase family 4 protein [Nocardioidaceae bacterium]
MRILHVTDCYLPQVGGIEMHVHDLAERQRRAGHDVHVLTSTPGGNVVDPAWVRRLDGRTPTGIGRSLAATRRVEEVFLGEPFDVVHAHVSVISPLSMSTARQAAARRVPTVVTVHSLWSSLGPVPPMLESLLRLRTWPVVWSAVSTVAAAALQETLGGTATVVSVPNGVDPDEWQPQTQPSDTQLTIACVMRLARRKRPMPLLRMLRRLHQQVPDEIDFRVVIIGDGPARPAMERFLRAHRMDGWVILLGRLERPQILDVFRSSHVYVAPAEMESFGIAALEARCAGLPVVASSRGGVGEFVTHGIDGLLGSSDRDMVAAMHRLLTDPALRRSMALHNQAVSPTATWTAAVDGATRLYELAERQLQEAHTDAVRAVNTEVPA